MILIARIYVSISHSKLEKHTKALQMFFTIMKDFIKHTKTPYIKNSPHQKEIVYALRMISRYGDTKELPHYNITAWAATRGAIERQYNDGFDKLDAYGSICDFTQNTKLNTLTLRKDFYGIFDAMDKRLRMIGLPEIRFQQSPSILLRVIKYIQLGFTPNKAIVDAMLLWQPTEETNMEKLHVLCEKIFEASADKLSFAYHLKESQLLAKLFDFTKNVTSEEVVVFFRKQVGKK